MRTQQELEADYERYAANPRKRSAWSGENPGNQAAQEELRSLIRALAKPQLASGLPILDVGCGTGGWLRTLAEVVPTGLIYGVDALPQHARAAADAVPGAHILEADAHALPFADGTFALVTLFTVLLGMPPRDIETVLAECHRVLARGGILIAYEPRAPNPFNPSTRRVRRADINLPEPFHSRTLTLLPPLARRLGSLTGVLYPTLAALPPLRTHRLWWHVKS